MDFFAISLHFQNILTFLLKLSERNIGRAVSRLQKQPLSEENIRIGSKKKKTKLRGL
jgi:hypothetical protein